MNSSLRLIASCSLLVLQFGSFLHSQTWEDVGGGTNNSSHGMCLWDGKLVNGGSYNNPCNRVATWDGSSWQCLGGGVGIVARAAIEFGGDLIVCGDFWNVGQPCVGCNGIARWNGTAWLPLDNGFNNDVLCLAIWDGQLVAGGDFTQADGVPVSRIAKWNGTSWVGIGGPTDFDNDIRCMVEFEDELWVGGDFNNVAGCTPCDGLVKWNGTAWVGGDVGVDITGGVDSTVRVLYVDPSGDNLYMGGHFIELTIDGITDTDFNGVAVYDGSDWTPLGTGVDNYVRAIHEYNGNIIVGGDFLNAGGSPASKVAKWNPVSGTWSAMGTGMNDYVKSMEVYGGYLYAGGPFTTADGVTRNRIARWYETPSVLPVAGITASDLSICAGECVTFTDNSTGSPTSWDWTFPGGSIASSTLENPGTVCFSTPGIHVVELEACNSFGCNTSDVNITVSADPVAVATNGGPFCEGETIDLTSVGGFSTDDWTGPLGFTATDDPTPSISSASLSMAGTYTVVVTNPAGCSDTATTNVVVNANPVASATNGGPYCEGETIDLTSVGGLSTDDWTGPGGYTASNDPTPSISSATLGMAGTYTVTVTNAAGCTDTATTVVVILDAPDAVAVNTGPYCVGDTIFLNSVGGTSLDDWSGPGGYTATDEQSPFIVAATLGMAGTYTVTVTNGLGCSSTATTNVVVLDNPDDGVTLAGGTLTSDQAGAIYQWVDCDAGLSAIAGETGQDFTPTVNGNYAVIVTVGSCIDTSACTNVIVVNVNAPISSRILKAFPNPTDGRLVVITPISGELTIYDVDGRRLLANPISEGEHVIDLAMLPNGVYVISVVSDEGFFAARVIRQ